MIKEAERIKHISEYYFSKKLKSIKALNDSGLDIINLGIGNPDIKPPAIVNDTLSASLHLKQIHGYQSYNGIPKLRTAIKVFYKNQYSVDLDCTNEILPLHGSKEGIMHISMSFLNPGDLVLLPNPGYPAYEACAKIAGASAVYYNMTSSSDVLDELQNLKSDDLDRIKLMWINYPHMPTGKKATLEDFNDIAEFCLKHNILLCNDNPYNFILNSTPLSLLNNSKQRSHVLELFSLSKSFNMPGYRVGALLGNENLIQTVLKFKSNMDSGMFKGIQLAASEVLKIDNDWFEKLNTTYLERKKIGVQIIEHLQCSYQKDTAGFFLWAKVPNQDGEHWSELILNKARVFITPGHIFGSNGNQYLRLSLCAPISKLTDALSRIKEAI